MGSARCVLRWWGDGAGTPAAFVEYGWLVGGTDEDSLEIWAEGAARVGGLPEEMDSTRAELLGAYAVMHKGRQWQGTVRVWVDNDNVVRGLEKRLERETRCSVIRGRGLGSRFPGAGVKLEGSAGGGC